MIKQKDKLLTAPRKLFYRTPFGKLKTKRNIHVMNRRVRKKILTAKAGMVNLSTTAILVGPGELWKKHKIFLYKVIAIVEPTDNRVVWWHVELNYITSCLNITRVRSCSFWTSTSNEKAYELWRYGFERFGHCYKVVIGLFVWKQQ